MLRTIDTDSCWHVVVLDFLAYEARAKCTLKDVYIFYNRQEGSPLLVKIQKNIVEKLQVSPVLVVFQILCQESIDIKWSGVRTRNLTYTMFGCYSRVRTYPRRSSICVLLWAGLKCLAFKIRSIRNVYNTSLICQCTVLFQIM